MEKYVKSSDLLAFIAANEFEIATVPPYPPPVPPTPPPPPPPPPPPIVNGEVLIWQNRYQRGLAPGGELVFIANVLPSTPGVSASIMGTTNETDATFTWTFPDGRVFPPPGEPRIYSTMGAGSLNLVGKSGGWLANLPDQYIPAGQHILRIKATGQSSLVIIVN
jgi:hypothetical protein